MIHDPELINQAMQLLSLKVEIIMTLDWMITHFDYERQNMQWGSESDELKSAKKLTENIKKIGC